MHEVFVYNASIGYEVLTFYGSLRQVQWHVNYRPNLQKTSEVNETHVSFQTAELKNTCFNKQD